MNVILYIFNEFAINVTETDIFSILLHCYLKRENLAQVFTKSNDLNIICYEIHPDEAPVADDEATFYRLLVEWYFRALCQAPKSPVDRKA